MCYHKSIRKILTLEKILAIVSLALIIIAGVLGFRHESQEVTNFLDGIIPNGHRTESIDGERFALYEEKSRTPDFYLINESAPGYGGKMVVSVLVDTLGTIQDMKVAKHRETPSFLKKTEKKGLINSILGKSYDDPFIKGEDIDVVTGATLTSETIILCAQAGSKKIARDQLNLKVSALETPTLEIGIPEVSIIALFMLAIIGVYRKTRYKKTLRWFTMLSGLFILGFWFAVPLTLSKINTFLLGYFPDWHSQMFWYLIIGGFLLTILVTGKNIYCTWICPLGGLQECFGLLGPARTRFSRKFNRTMSWIQRGVALLAILLALYFRNPVKLNYEIFGVALSLTGATYLFIMTGLFLLASIFIKRPYCIYLCPITPISDFIRVFRPRKNPSCF